MLYDRVYFSTATTGTGTITASAAETGFRTMATAASGSAIPNGTEIEYAITDGTAWETGTGLVGSSGTTLTRVLSQSSTGALLNLSGSSKVFITRIAARDGSVAAGGTGASTFTANALLKGNTTSAISASNVSDNGSTVSIGSGIGFSIARTAVTSPAAADGNVFSGTYTPTSFNTTNIAASTPQSAQYLCVGNTVTVSGQIDIDPTLVGFAILGLSLPIASAITSAVQLSGVFNCPDAAGGGVYGDAANDRATFQFTATSASNLTYYYTFTYRVL